MFKKDRPLIHFLPITIGQIWFVIALVAACAWLGATWYLNNMYKIRKSHIPPTPTKIEREFRALAADKLEEAERNRQTPGGE